MIFHIVYEDQVSAAVLHKVLLNLFPDHEINFISMGNRGRGYIQNKINIFNNLNPELIFFILADLDRDTCPPELINNWLQRPVRKNLTFRIAVREIESWLLADTKGFSQYLNLKHEFINKEVSSPDSLMNPKEKLIALVERCKKKELKKDIVKKQTTSFKQGPGYNTQLTEYIFNFWDIKRASAKSESFSRAIKAIQKFRESISQSKM